MDTQHCLRCELHKDRVDQDGFKYCYCFFNPDKGRWVAEIENCPKLGKHSGSSEIPNCLNESADYARRQVEELLPVIKKYNDYSEEQIEELRTHLMAMFMEGAGWQKEKMLKEAVEGFVATHLTSEGTKVTVNSGYLPKEFDIKNGDKVKLIIVNED